MATDEEPMRRGCPVTLDPAGGHKEPLPAMPL